MKPVFYVIVLFTGIHSFAQSAHSQQSLGAKPGLWINGLNCKIGHFTQSCTPKTCDSLTLFPGDTIHFCTDADVDLTSDTAYYMQWNFNGSSNYPSPVMNYAPTPTPICYDAVYSAPGHYTIDVFYNGWLTAYPDRDCYSFGPSHWIIGVTVMPGPNGIVENSADIFSVTADPVEQEIKVNTGREGVMEIYSGLGERELSVRMDAGMNTIPTNEFTAGIYFCRFISGDKIFVRKVIMVK
jgi:hypothetical protein